MATVQPCGFAADGATIRPDYEIMPSQIRLRRMAEVLLNRRCLPLLCVLSAVVLSQCSSDGYQHATISGDSRTRVHVLYDSPKLQSIVDRALQARDERRHNFWRTDNFVQRAADDMRKEPGYEVPGKTRFKILFESDALMYSKVEFESDSFKGQVGWLSRSSFDDPRAGLP